MPAETALRGPAAPGAEDPVPKASWAKFGKGRWDSQPSQPSAVLIATVGVPIPPKVLRRAVALSEGRAVSVVSIARVYGSSFGLPNPGLLPTRTEMEEQLALVNQAIDRLERAGTEAWGQVATTRRFAKTIAQAARAREVSHVLVVTAEVARWRQVIEGDVARDVRRRIGKQVEVEGISV